MLAACGGSSKRAPATTTGASTEQSSATTSAQPTEAPKPPAKPVSYPAPPEEPAPKGTWRVTIEFPRLHGKPTAMTADATGVYLAGAVLTEGDVRGQRWAVVKLDGNGAVAWGSHEELPRSPAPARIVAAEGGVVVAGSDSSYEAARLLMIEKRDAKGKRTWSRRFTARDASCTNAGCAGKDVLGGVAVRAGTVVYNATVDRPVEHAFGELSLAKGAPGKASFQTRSDLRALDLTADDGAFYLLEENLSNVTTLVKIADGKTAWKYEAKSGPQRVAADATGLLLWDKTVEKWSKEGDLVWTSTLAGEHIDVASDASGLYATVLIKGPGAPYFGIAKIDPGSGAVQWVRKTSDYSENRPSAFIATDKDWIYVFGYEAEKWFVEKRRKSDGALGEVATTPRTVDKKK